MFKIYVDLFFNSNKMDENVKKVEIIVKMEHTKGIEDYLLNLLFRMIKIWIICFLIWILYINLPTSFQIF